jgi:hypothetical protein
MREIILPNISISSLVWVLEMVEGIQFWEVLVYQNVKYERRYVRETKKGHLL